MKEVMLENINAITSRKSDKLFMLGDMTFGDKDGLLDFINNIHVPVFIVSGNHDANNMCNFLRRNGVNVLPKGSFSFMKDDLKITLSHQPIDSRYLVKDEFNICGHKHSKGGKLLSPQHYDCGVDNNNFYPVSLSDILHKRKIHNRYRF